MQRYLFLADAFVLFVAVFLLLTPAAHAYLDPGSGSYAIQIALAGVFGAFFGWKAFVRRILCRVRARNKKQEKTV